MSNAEIADRLTSLAQLLAAQKENPFKIKAYRRAARTIKTLSESLDELVRSDADLTEYAGIGKGISGAIREIVLSGTMRQLDTLRSQASPEVAAISEHPALDPVRVLRIYKKLQISSIDELKRHLESGELAARMGARMAQHVRQGLMERQPAAALSGRSRRRRGRAVPACKMRRPPRRGPRAITAAGSRC